MYMASSMASTSMNPSPTVSPNSTTATTRRRRNQKEIQNESNYNTDDQNHAASLIQWKSQSQQNLYSDKLLRALRQVQQTATPSPSRVRQAADRVLAITAKGKSMWSRAILTGGGSSSWLKLKLARRKKTMAKQQRRVMMNITTGGGSSGRHHHVVVTGNNRLMQRGSKLGLKSGGLPAMQRKARALGRLVPGCRKQPLPVVLEEASDYIPALEMQVRVMTALAELLSGSGSSSLSTHPSSPWPDHQHINSGPN